jgi:hypothetical protein
MAEVTARLSEADIRAAILDSASENSALLVTLAKTSSGLSLLSAQTTHTIALQEELTTHEAILVTLKAEVETRFKRHNKFRNSHSRRLFYRATNMLAKFDAKAMQEERAYFETLGRQSKAEKRSLELQRNYFDALKKTQELERVAKEHGDTHDRIDELYNRLFAGLTPGFPREDQREAQFYAAKQNNDAVRQTILAAGQVLKILGVTKTSVERAKTCLRNGQQTMSSSGFLIFDSFYWPRRANEYIATAIRSTGRIEAELKSRSVELLELKIEADDFLQSAEVKIEQLYNRETTVLRAASSLGSLESAIEVLERIFTLVKEKEGAGLREIKTTARLLEDTRQELEETRKGIFETVAGFGEAAPSYNECCDRAEGFCEVPAVRDEAEEEEVSGIIVTQVGTSFDGIALGISDADLQKQASIGVAGSSKPAPPGYQAIDAHQLSSLGSSADA